MERLGVLEGELAEEKCKFETAVANFLMVTQKAEAESKRADEEQLRVDAEQERTKHVDLLFQASEERVNKIA